MAEDSPCSSSYLPAAILNCNTELIRPETRRDDEVVCDGAMATCDVVL